MEAAAARRPAAAPRVARRSASWHPEACDVLARRLGRPDRGSARRHVGFTGGELRISPTPAMTLIDVDGYLPAQELAVLGASAAARAIRRLDIGGSIGIDFPTSPEQGSAAGHRRAAIDAHPAAAVRAHRGQRLRLRPDRPAEAARLAGRAGAGPRRLRSAGADAAGGARRPGAKRLVAHPAVIAVLESKPALARRARAAGRRRDRVAGRPRSPMSAGYAEKL